jgi:hypothetical protein
MATTNTENTMSQNNSNGTFSTMEEMQAELQRLREENTRLQTPREHKLSVKVNEKGTISVYGLTNRFPVSLYSQQWKKLIDFIPTIQAAMEANKELLDKVEAAFEAAKAAKIVTPATK